MISNVAALIHQACQLLVGDLDGEYFVVASKRSGLDMVSMCAALDPLSVVFIGDLEDIFCLILLLQIQCRKRACV